MHILLPETGNCPSESAWEKDHRKSFMINLHGRMLPDPVGIEPGTYWSSVWCASNWANEASFLNLIWCGETKYFCKWCHQTFSFQKHTHTLKNQPTQKSHSNCFSIKALYWSSTVEKSASLLTYLWMFKMGFNHLSYILCMWDIQSSVYFIQDVDRSRFKQQHGQNQWQGNQWPARTL